MPAAIVWFRRDLRCRDNPALAAACQKYRIIIPLYIAEEDIKKRVGSAQCWWLHYSLEALQKELQAHGLDLCLRQGSPLNELKKLIKEYKIDTVYWNRCYEPNDIVRDKMIKAELESLGIKVKSFNGSLLNEPWEIRNQQNNNFKIFTPFWKQCLKKIVVPGVFKINCWPTHPSFDSDLLGDWELLPRKPDWAKKFTDYWEPGERGAIKKLNRFINTALVQYETHRDIPSLAVTSGLSPHLHFGELSPWQIWRAVEPIKADPNYHLNSVEFFLREIGWREFSYYLLYHYPQLPDTNLKEEFNIFPWQHNEEVLACWQRGLTGFPIIDAGMRELWQTGYMHNRVRMIVASFLVKDLLIDWRKGAEWFLDTLLDADLANNSVNWQWVSGTGIDSAPYFRIFNPVHQGEKFDPQGEYVKRWVPELRTIPTCWIHKPWQAPPQELTLSLGTDYPFPIVDHAFARKRALSNYQRIKQ